MAQIRQLIERLLQLRFVQEAFLEGTFDDAFIEEVFFAVHPCISFAPRGRSVQH
jgi:hypothetical protein